MRFFLPALLAILIHLSFFGFKKVPTVDIASRVASKQVMLLPQDSVVPYEQKLLAWMNILDSSYVIQPNRKYGFSTTFTPTKLNDMSLKLKNVAVENEKKSKNFLPIPWQDSHTRIRRQWIYNSVGITPVNSEDYKIDLKCPVWLNEENKILPQLFENIDEIKTKLKKNLPPKQESVLEVTFLGPDVFPKVKLAYSCGVKELDIAALRTFTVKSKAIPTTVENTIGSYYITVKWYSE